MDAYAEETETREKLDLIIDFDPKLFTDFERDPNEPPVNINKKMHRKRFEKEQTISKFLDDLDYYLEYLIVLYKYSPLQLKKFIFNKVLQVFLVPGCKWLLRQINPPQIRKSLFSSL